MAFIKLNKFPDYQAALVACGRGYHDPAIAEVVAFKSLLPFDAAHGALESTVHTLACIGIAAAENPKRPLLVLDFGGGCGINYFCVSTHLKVPLRWIVVETSTMADRARHIAQGRFEVFDDLGKIDSESTRFDVVCAFGSLQYVPDPLTTIRALVALRAQHLVIGRFPWWGDADMFGVQVSNLSDHLVGPLPPGVTNREISVPITLTNYKTILHELNGYEIALTIPSPGPEWDYRVAPTQRVPEVSLVLRRKN